MTRTKNTLHLPKSLSISAEYQSVKLTEKHNNKQSVSSLLPLSPQQLRVEAIILDMHVNIIVPVPVETAYFYLRIYRLNNACQQLDTIIEENKYCAVLLALVLCVHRMSVTAA